MIQTPPRAIGLTALLASLGETRARGGSETAVTALEIDSRKVRAGSVFVALRGERADGHAFVGQAIANGAVAVVVETARAGELAVPENVMLVGVADTRRALSRLAATFYGWPSQALSVIGVTGTNGKTTTTHLIQAILEEAGVRCGRIGTLGAQFGGAMWTLENTTPLALELQATLAAMHERGAEAVAMEVSSHALALERVADVEFEIGVLTNITHDHLDFHGSFKTYIEEKRKLFGLAKAAVFNVDDATGLLWDYEDAHSGRRSLSYSIVDSSDLWAKDLVLSARGSSFSLDGNRVNLNLPGRFNIYNALAALGVARLLGIEDALAARALASVASVPGRMEHFEADGVDVLVDYAHTPDALDNVLRAAREGARGRVIVVFGCGGDRDRGKRPEMGRIASERADRVIVTSDNPRTEDMLAIVDGIVAGIPAGTSAHVELDRGAAIRQAIAEAAPGDVVVVAGKGHETHQIIGSNVRHFDDRDAVRAALAKRGER
jgi:UDP-N-acetylmuramoyl-L-alanyl-D-glutamate--2,6-diaminopimelate ligase